MTRTLTFISRLILLGLAALAACEEPSNPTAPSPGAARMAVANSTHQTSITINAPSVSVGQAATISVTLWTDGHPLGGRLLVLSVNGVAYDSKHSARLGTAKFTVTGLSGGLHALSAEFLGDNNFFGSTGGGSITVTP